MSLPSIAELNSSDLSCLSLLFEHSSALQTILCTRKPFTSYEDLIAQTHQILLQLDIENQKEILNSHPRIGAPLQTISKLSQAEQGRQEPNLEATLHQLAILNSKYEVKFGFRFVVFVNGRLRSEIVKVMETRMENSLQDEINTAIEDMVLIARSRLAKLQN
jgi:2-oxo-4-hydroxy-4-carboxy--5-ureidoimidazoline (OHCU) decarboxylase